ncbi:GNAT family N-acetyltransferase [Actinoplanes sp. NPDC051861]|uniref:GNAT family N-acetyltransferase n=1 Tax=Actinoplanes sp. NPDC051861 TaxID=3155170 RepID=UPI00342645F2
MTLVVRPIDGPDELPLFNDSFPYILNDEIESDLTAGRRHPAWLWVALREGRVTARAGWWSRPGDPSPMHMDVFDVTSADDGLALLAAAGMTTDYLRFVPPDWRSGGDPLWMTTLTKAGARLFVERLRLEWRPGTPLPLPRGRLSFRPPHDGAELVDLMTQVLEGTLDAHSRADLGHMSAREAAEEQYRSELTRYASPHDWWRVGVAPDGSPVGFVIPAHNGYNPVIAYIGVVPEHRGHGYVDELLGEGTRVLAAQDVPRIRASTDLGNVPTAAAFARAGYITIEHQVDMTWS